ncbi:MAG: hypothetical protein HZB46_13910 [Solirubrobacterales bacterium]|nr:hypothetical protein [Solirubrobacterales bacterium]
MHRTSKAVFAAALCSLALPAASQAATKDVFAGFPGAPPKSMPKDANVAAFFPGTVKIAAGDSLRLQPTGCPAVTVSKAGDVPSFLSTLEATPVAGAKDAAGAAFWFNGQPTAMANPAVFFGAKSPATFTGKLLSSGFPMGPGAPKPFVVKFPKAGTYTLACPLFAGMEGTVTVLRKGAEVPSAKADMARARQAFKKALARVRKLDKQAAPAGDVIVAGPDAATGEMLYRFTPAAKTVKVGTPVTLTMSTGTREIHTFTFASNLKKLAKKAEGFLGAPAAKGQGPALDPVQLYRSEPAGTALSYDGANHGDGFLNTGILDDDAGSPFPKSDTVTFTKPGTYKFLCLVHPDMQGKVTVTG